MQCNPFYSPVYSQPPVHTSSLFLLPPESQATGKIRYNAKVTGASGEGKATGGGKSTIVCFPPVQTSSD